MSDLFAGDELASFGDMTELLEKIEYFSTRPEERAAFARRGRERVLREHTYQRRMQRLLDFIRERKSDWPARGKGEGLPASLPPDMRMELADLLAKMGLPETAAFDDVILRLRQQSGKLSPLETNLLFLDEWRKLYRKDK